MLLESFWTQRNRDMQLTRSALSDGKIWLDPATVEICDGPYFDWMQDPEVLRYLEARFSDRTHEGLRSFVDACDRSPNQHLFAIRLLEGGRHVGNIKLQVDPHHNRGDIGILIGDSTQQGLGIGISAIRTICRYGFGTLGLAKVTAGCYAPNFASLKAFLRVGFTEEAIRPSHFFCDGVWVDGIFMGLLQNDER